MRKSVLAWCGVVALTVGAAQLGVAQRAVLDSGQATAPHRTRLILKDGSYQVVMSYQVKGKVVSYLSAERGGGTEEIPADLIDWDATHKWEQKHPADGEQVSAPAIDPELLKEEADRAALTPEVAPNLSLPELDSVLVLDYYHGAPELVPLDQSDGDLNRETAHNIVKKALDPRAAAHGVVTLKGVTSLRQMHVDVPVMYLRLGDDSGISRSGQTFTVDTHGAGSGKASAGEASGGSPDSGYVIVRADVRTDSRVIASFNIGWLGGTRRQEDVIETVTEVLPGGHWMKITPKRSLDFGEYALVEVLSERELNLGVWDFGVHPVAPDNKDALKPVPKRPVTLERRGGN
jgi:hypothetical protein